MVVGDLSILDSADICGHIPNNSKEKEMVITRLKRCPFCGEKAVVDTYDYKIDNGIVKTYFVRCGKCQAETFECETVEEAINRWNQRVSDEDLAESEIIKLVDE